MACRTMALWGGRAWGELRVPSVLGSKMGLPAGAGETVPGNDFKFVGEWVYFIYKRQWERSVKVEGEGSLLKREL